MLSLHSYHPKYSLLKDRVKVYKLKSIKYNF